MSDFITIVAVIAIIGWVIGRQLRGEPLRGKRVVLLPAILTVIGISDLGGTHQPVKPIDIGCLVVGGLFIAAIGLAQGWVTKLETRDGALWGQMPAKGLWLWVLLITTRLVMTGVAVLLGANVAASSSTILVMLGINRLAQAAIVLPRAMSTHTPFAPEKDGKTFLAELTGHADQHEPTRPAQGPEWQPTTSAAPGRSVDWPAVGRQATAFAQNRGTNRREDEHDQH